MRAVLRGVAPVCAVLVIGLCAVASAAPVGQITEFTTGLGPGAQPSFIAAGPDGTLWFADAGQRAIGRVTPGGQITEFSAGLQPGSIPRGLTVGPDGNLWFTDQGVPKAVGRITLGGQITEFPLSSGGIGNIAAGADGNLWFATGTNGIGRITPSGQITNFTSGLNMGAEPVFVAPGPDGNIWFSDSGTTSAIGRITPSGQISEFSSGLIGQAILLAPGPDGNVWFTDPAAPAIGQITPIGQITEFGVGLTSGQNLPLGIASGPDGNVWFADEQRHAIGRITPSGQITEFSNGVNGVPQLIAPGPDGNLWFTEVGMPAIGRIGAGAPAPSLAVPAVNGSGQTGTQQTCGGDRWADWAGQQPALDAVPWDGYQWSLDGTPLPGATGRTFTPGSSDADHRLTCTVTVTYPLLGVTDSATSAPVTVAPLAPGPVLLPGPQGAPGLPGPPGEIELVTCTTHTKTVIRHHKKVKVKQQKCSAKLVSGPVTFTTSGAAAHATLSRRGVVYATGSARDGRTRLVAGRPLRPGRYTLTLASARGRSRSVVMID